MEKDLRLDYRRLAAKIENETASWSGGFHFHPSFPEIVSLGEEVIPFLVEDIVNPKLGFHWQFNALCFLCEANNIDLPIGADDSWDIVSIIKKIREWGLEKAYIS